MNSLKILQIPPTLAECIDMMRSYAYIDKYNGCVDVREVSPYLVPGFVLGVCGQIPFLFDCAESYINDVADRGVDEVIISKLYVGEMAQNHKMLNQMFYYEYTATDCDLVLSVLLNAIVFSIYGNPFRHFKRAIDQRVNKICDMANIYPINFNLPESFRDSIKTTLVALPGEHIEKRRKTNLVSVFE